MRIHHWQSGMNNEMHKPSPGDLRVRLLGICLSSSAMGGWRRWFMCCAEVKACLRGPETALPDRGGHNGVC